MANALPEVRFKVTLGATPLLSEALGAVQVTVAVAALGPVLTSIFDGQDCNGEN